MDPSWETVDVKPLRTLICKESTFDKHVLKIFSKANMKSSVLPKTSKFLKLE